MIFTLEHIEQMRNRLYQIFTDRKGDPMSIVKTQTRRWSEKVPTPLLYNRYKAGQLYAVQEGRGKPGLKDMKIRVIRKWIETTDLKKTQDKIGQHVLYPRKSHITNIITPPDDIFIADFDTIPISAEDAKAEGGYDPKSYEIKFRELNKKWDGIDRVGLEFEVVRV